MTPVSTANLSYLFSMLRESDQRRTEREESCCRRRRGLAACRAAAAAPPPPLSIPLHFCSAMGATATNPRPVTWDWSATAGVAALRRMMAVVRRRRWLSAFHAATAAPSPSAAPFSYPSFTLVCGGRNANPRPEAPFSLSIPSRLCS